MDTALPVIDVGTTDQLPDWELEQRRMEVLRLRLHRYGQKAIASALGVDQSTVSRDLAWIAKNRSELFGPNPKFQVEQEIGEAIDVYAEAERCALRDYNKLKQDEIKAKMGCLRTVILARTARVHLLQDLGFIERNLGTVGLSFRADAVRTALRDEGLLIPERTITAEDVDPDDEVDKWLRSA